MTFYSFSFLAFFLVFTAAVLLTSGHKTQTYIFLTANLIFYAYWDIGFLFLLLLIVLITYILAFFHDKTKNSAFITSGIVLSLLTLGIFKYFNFFTSSFSRAFGIQDSITLDLVLPLGISFYLFQVMSYLIDLKRGLIGFDPNPLKLFVYITSFFQITSGPIVKARDFLPQLEKQHHIKKENVYYGFQLFLTGLTKKIVFADRIGVAVNAVYSAPDAYNGISILFAVIGYALQIYFDFSGYSDMAIGLAKIWDFDLGQNFNAPYLARNPSDFWRRWHISLSSWFKEYVFIPLGGNRKGRFRTYLNVFITMLLSGIWHGANMTFIVWGAIHGLGSVVNKVFRDFRIIKNDTIESVNILLNCIFVTFAWIFFRSPSVSSSFAVITGLFRSRGITYINVFVVIYSVIAGIWFFASRYKNNGNIIVVNLDLDTFTGKLAVAVWVFLIAAFMYVGDSAFIYAQF